MWFVRGYAIISVMQAINLGSHSLTGLFERMRSDHQMFKASLCSSPNSPTLKMVSSTASIQPCSCKQQEKMQSMESQFYLSQSEIIEKAAVAIKQEENVVFEQLLGFMKEYLSRIVQELAKEKMCECKRQQINQNIDLEHKVAFLRQENHKFFKMIEEKSSECDVLKIKKMELQQTLQSYQPQTPIALMTSGMPSTSRLTTDRQALRISSELTSRVIESSTSRVSEFHQPWPQLTLPMGEMGHKQYFQDSGVAQARGYFQTSVLAEKSSNLPYEDMSSTFRKSKIFAHH